MVQNFILPIGKLRIADISTSWITWRLHALKNAPKTFDKSIMAKPRKHSSGNRTEPSTEAGISRYCRTVDPRFLERLNNRKPTTMAALADIWYGSQNADYGRSQHYNDSRYHMLNLHATFTKGTVEFRLFQFDAPADGKQNGLHAGQLKSYIQLCLALSQMAKTVRTASPKPQQNENPKYAMRTWLLRLGFIGDEFKTARELLTKRLDGDAAFRSGRAAA